MNFINKSIIFAFISFVVGCLAADVQLGMKLLVLSTTSPDSVIRSLQAYSIEYDSLIYDYENPLKGNLPLYTEDNQPKYYGVVLANGVLSVYHKDTGLWGSILDSDQWNYLYEYQKKYGIRIVALDDTPSAEFGTSIFDTSIWGVSSTQDMTMAENDIAKSIFKEAGVKSTASINTRGLYHVPCKIENEKIATPIINLQPNEDVKAESIAVVYVKNDNGERLSFYISFGEWSINSVMLNHLWISWVTRSLYAGERRVTFTPHVDDVFISTGLLNYETNELESAENAYRSTVEDFENLKKWQDSIVDKLPEGSFIRSELAFNGNGILAAINPTLALEIDGERHCDIEYVKVPGKGVDRWPEANYTLPYDKDFFENDSLFAYFDKEENSKNFFWSSHTFSHENLDEATTVDADNEIRVNIEIAKLLGIYDKSYFSSKSIITPQISGLRNVDAINVLLKYGIEAGTGDLSRPTLINKENPYLPFFTTKESSNFEGFPIIPRSPTEVYYSSSTDDENTYIYNLMYKDVLGESTWDQIIERETDRTLNLMMNLRNEAHQFHQINLRSHDLKDKESLLQKWSDAVLGKYVQYVDWPVTSLKLDDQAQLYLDRYNRINYCDIEKSAVIEGDYVTAIKISPKSIERDCKIPITLPQNVYKDTKESKISYEKRGKDRLVAWISFAKGDKESKTIKLNPPLAWATDAKALEEEKEQKVCWSEALGFRCCEDGESIVEYIDEENSLWGVTKDNQWCGIIKNEKCWSEDFGLPCCESETLDYVLDNGVIGYEEKYENDTSRPAGGWCGIKSAANRVYNNARELFKEQLNL